MKPWLIFRYRYSVQEVWGPYVTEDAALEALREILQDGTGGRDAREYATKEIDHFKGWWRKEEPRL